MNLAAFAKWAIRTGPFDGCNLDGGDIQDKAVECGLLTSVPYDLWVEQQEERAKRESWYCEPCAVEVYDRRCPHCGKTKRERH